MGVMGGYRCMGVICGYRCMRVNGCIQVSEGVYGCSWVFGRKSQATRPMKNRRFEGVVTVDLRSCVCIGVYRCLWESWVVIRVWVFMGVYRYLRESMGVHGFSDVNQRQRVL